MLSGSGWLLERFGIPQPITGGKATQKLSHSKFSTTRDVGDRDGKLCQGQPRTVCQNNFTDHGDALAIHEAETSLTSSANTSSTAQANDCGRELLGVDIYCGGQQITRLMNSICRNHENWPSTADICAIEEGVSEHRQPRVFTSGDTCHTDVPDPRISQDFSASDWIDAELLNCAGAAFLQMKVRTCLITPLVRVSVNAA
jgi:hypothetical protein